MDPSEDFEDNAGHAHMQLPGQAPAIDTVVNASGIDADRTEETPSSDPMHAAQTQDAFVSPTSSMRRTAQAPRTPPLLTNAPRPSDASNPSPKNHVRSEAVLSREDMDDMVRMPSLDDVAQQDTPPRAPSDIPTLGNVLRASLESRHFEIPEAPLVPLLGATMNKARFQSLSFDRSFGGSIKGSAPQKCFRCGSDHPDTVCRDLHEFLQKQKIPKYQKLPDVEVTFKMFSISDLEAKKGTFLADFTLELNWVDTVLQRDMHFTEDYQSQRLMLFPAFEPRIFSPEVLLTNAVDILSPLPGSDDRPQIQAETEDGLWLQRKLHFRGIFACDAISYSNFPLDSHALPITLRLRHWGNFGAPKAISPGAVCREVRGGRKDLLKEPPWPRHSIAKEAVHLGDLRLFAWGVRHLQRDEQRQDTSMNATYEIIMVVRRGFFRHFFTFFILSVTVLSGATSLFCPLSVDMLAGRLSINVTVLLSMVAFSVQRPSAIEAVPYNTLFDTFVQMCTCMTASLSMCNLATFLTCFHVTEGCDECVRKDRDMCKTGSCGSKAIDCIFFYLLIALLATCDIALFVWVWYLRKIELTEFRARCGDLFLDRPGQHSRHSCFWRSCCCVRRLRGQLQSQDSAVVNREPRTNEQGPPCFFVRQGGQFSLLPGGQCEKAQLVLQSQGRVISQDGLSRSVHTRRVTAKLASAKTLAHPRRLLQPAVLDGPDTQYLDLGGGEVGYYRYSFNPDADASQQIECSGSRKMEWPGLKELLLDGGKDEQKLSELRSQLVAYVVEQATPEPEQDAPPRLQRGVDGTRSSARLLRASHRNSSDSVASYVSDGDRMQLLAGITGELAVLMGDGEEEVCYLFDHFIQQLETDLRTATARKWEVFYFVLPKKDEAFYERIAIGWLLEHTDLRLTDTFAKDPKLHEYMRQQVTSWALLSGRKNIGELEQEEFVERLMPLSRQITFERQALEALEWFRVMDQAGSGTVTISEIMNYMLQSEALLQAVIRHRLFVGTLAGGTSSVQLTVADPDPELQGEVVLHVVKVGNRSPPNLGIFPHAEWVDRNHMLRWEQKLSTTFAGDSDDFLGEEEFSQARLGSRRNIGLTSTDEHSHEPIEWPSELRGIFVGISALYYAAHDAGITERLIQKKDTLIALSHAIEEELAQGCAQVSATGDTASRRLQLHQRKVANLVMAHCLINRVLHDDAWLYFRRTWLMGNSSFVATWSLGVFLNGKRRAGIQAQAGAFTRVRSRLETAATADSSVLEAQKPRRNLAQRVVAAVRLTSLARRSQTVD
eukprot:TRINITY_DN41923_c0_g1_i1.p1 TRINITY_DN41923_c0_g1~~TRINITY_DN41923_c0_g1_i1.p1  ORF type:complete len:1283 (+),score=205.77 TRINITY_DN41923_c0_g1_i1:231-4079(+)